MKPIFICYKKCSTCTKARKHLIEKNIEFEEREITTQTPTQDELKKYLELSKLPIKRFFNTSGIKYRELGLKDTLDDMSLDQQLALLSSDGMLIKRPLLITADRVYLGYKESDYDAI